MLYPENGGATANPKAKESGRASVSATAMIFGLSILWGCAAIWEEYFEQGMERPEAEDLFDFN